MIAIITAMIRIEFSQLLLTILSVLVSRFNDLSEPSIADSGASGITEENSLRGMAVLHADGRAAWYVLDAAWRRS